MDEFTKRYKTLTTSELLKILDEPNDYTSSALEAAKIEIEKRKLTKDEIIKVKENIETQRLTIEKQVRKNRELEYRLKGFFKRFIDRINPIKEGLEPTEVTIRSVTIVFSGILIYQLSYKFNFLIFIFSDLNANWELGLIENFFPLIIIPIALILFWNRKTKGWILLSIFLTYSLVGTIVSFILSLGVEPTGIPALDSLFPTVPPIMYLLIIGFYGGSLWEICREENRLIYRIEKKDVQQSILITASIYLLLIYSF